MSKGIALCGTVLVDIIKIVDSYPERGMLTGISGIGKALGGLVPNVAIDLAIMDPSLPLTVCGAVGDDENGELIRKTLEGYGADTKGIEVVPNEVTGFTDVMTERITGARTFFTMDGANKSYLPSVECLDRLAERADILHIGYIHLMAAMDSPDDEYGTRLARILHAARARGLKTSVDVVSRPGFEPLLTAALPETDYVIVNEIEACGATGLSARNEDGQICLSALRCAAKKMFALGVKDTVVIHCPECGLLCRRDGSVTVLPSLDLPEGYIRGSVGAGDAFCAACLYSLWQNKTSEEILAFASAAAACNLSESDAVSGMRSSEKIWELSKKYGRKSLPDNE